MKPTLEPITGVDWMRQVQARLAAVERHRHPNASGGPEGDKGDKGDKGDTGEKGDKGDTGITGTPGIGLDSSWRYLGYSLEPKLATGITIYEAVGKDWSAGRFRRDGAGCVFLEGLLNYTGTLPLPIFTLPVGFRPATRQVFSVISGPSVPAQIEVLPTGVVNLLTAATYVSLSGITFMAEDALTVTWIPLALQNGWTDFDVATSGTAAYFIDSVGDVHLRGMIKGGTVGVQPFTLPVGTYATDFYQMFMTATGGAASGLARWDVQANNGRMVLSGFSGSGTNAWVSMAGIVIANPNGTWTATPALANAWVPYGGTWPPMQTSINRNGVIAMRGLITNGATGVPTVIAAAGAIPPRLAPTQTVMFLNGAGPAASGARVDARSDGSLAFVGFVNGGNNLWLGTNARWFVGAEGSGGSVGPAGPAGPAGATVNEAVAALIPSASNISTNSTAYTSWPSAGGGPLTATINKRAAASTLTVEVNVSTYATGTQNAFTFGISVDGAAPTSPVIAGYLGTMSVHFTYAGRIVLVGLGAGLHTLTLQVKVGSSVLTLVCDQGDTFGMTVREVGP